MNQLFGSLKTLFKSEPTCIDNPVFRLHYRFTFICLIACSILVTGRQYIGDPIDCMTKSEIPANLLDTFCWIHTTFSVNSAWRKSVGKEVPYPGIGKQPCHDDESGCTYHAYYQWVCFVLFFQALLFYLPHYFWKTIEGGRMNQIVLDLNSPIMQEETKMKNRNLLVDYLQTHLTHHQYLFLCYCLAEVINLINVVSQMFLMNRFLGGHFLTYGSQVIAFSEWDWTVRYDPMIRVFPRLTKCTFYHYGPSSDIEKHDAMCILPINIVNEKIYVFLWFWFILLAVASSFALAYRVGVIMIPRLRLLLLQSRSGLVDSHYLEIVLHRGLLGDYMILTMLAKNLEPFNFQAVISDLGRHLEGDRLITKTTTV